MVLVFVLLTSARMEHRIVAALFLSSAKRIQSGSEKGQVSATPELLKLVNKKAQLGLGKKEMKL